VKKKIIKKTFVDVEQKIKLYVHSILLCRLKFCAYQTQAIEIV